MFQKKMLLVVFLFFFFFSLPLIFTLLATSISHFLTAGMTFSRCSYNKILLLFLYLSLQISIALFLLELRQPVACFLVFSFFFSLHFKFLDMTIFLSLIIQTTLIQKQFPLFMLSLLNLQLFVLHKTLFAMRFPTKKMLSCIWVAYQLTGLFYIGFPVVLTDEARAGGRADGRTVT